MIDAAKSPIDVAKPALDAAKSMLDAAKRALDIARWALNVQYPEGSPRREVGTRRSASLRGSDPGYNGRFSNAR